MTTDLSNKVTTKIFAGCHINSEIRMHLNQSIQWKNATILASSSCSDPIMKEIHYHGKDYFGLYTQNKTLILMDLPNIQQNIRDQLKIYCPTLEVENIKICIFPQVFIA
ncbi:MAG TPA: hypothetical protein VGP47_11255 [Parachlamydiaceae bacterium]|nr:hypothetical protein [Parachlamydiaceae bacterium]